MPSLKEHVEEYKEKSVKLKGELTINYKDEIFKFQIITTTNKLSEKLKEIEIELKRKIARKDICKSYDLDNIL